MATTVNITQTIKGKDAGKLFHAMLVEVDILASGLIQVIEDANTPIYLNRIEVTPQVVRYTCGFDPKGTINMSEKKIVVEKYKIEMEICKEDFRSSSVGSQFGASAWNKSQSQDLNEAIEEYCVNTAQSTINDWIWNGKKGTGIEFDGFFEQFSDDDSVVKVKATDAPTPANVVSIFNKVKNAFPKVMRQGKVVTALFVSSDIYDAYETLLIGKGIDNGLGGDANTFMKYGKIEIHEMTIFPENTIVAVMKDNLVFATGLMQDYNEFRIVDGDEVGDLDGKVKFKMVFGGACGYAFGEEIVWYGDTPAGDDDTGGLAGRMAVKQTAEEVIAEINAIDNLEDLDIYDGDTRKSVISALAKRRSELGGEDLDAIVKGLE